MLQNEVDLRRPGLKPQPGEIEPGPGRGLHAQQIDIELPGPFQIGDHQGHMIDGFDLDGRGCRGGLGGTVHDICGLARNDSRGQPNAAAEGTVPRGAETRGAS